MELILGPEKFKTKFSFYIPNNIKRLGITISGGLDSTILSYLIFKELELTNRTDCQVNLFTIIKNDGSTFYAARIVNELKKLFPNQKFLYTNNCSNGDVWDGRGSVGIILIYSKNIVDILYTGVNRQVNQEIKKFKNNLKIYYQDENEWYKAPFLNMKKPNMLDLYYQLGVEFLIPYTHTCTVNTLGKCNNCYSCEEREWAFNELGKLDNSFIKPAIYDISFNGTWINNE